MTKILIIRFSSIGDIIQCMGIIGGIRNRFPDAEIHWITRKDMAPILRIDKRIDRIWEYDTKTGLGGLLQMAGELKKEQYTYVYDAHSNIRSNILKLILSPLPGMKPPCVLRSKERGKRFLLFNFGINKFDWPFRGVVSYRKPLEAWGITDLADDYCDWSFQQEIVDKCRAYVGSDTVTLVPSANWEMKRWPVSHWAKLIALLPNYRFIILAGKGDTFCEEIKAAAPERITNLAGCTTLWESCYITSISNVVVSGDTGFMHAADLFHVPTLALIGPTAFGFPTGSTVETLEVDLPCRPCTKDGRGKCKQAVCQKCMVDITPELVATKIRKLLPLSSATCFAGN